MTTQSQRAGPTNSIRLFFSENPNAEMKQSDVETLFQIAPAHAHRILRCLYAEGTLTKRKEGRLVIYRSAA